MASSAQLQAELQQLQGQAVTATAQLQTDLKAIGAAPVSQDWLNNYLSQTIGQGGIAGTVGQIEAQQAERALIPAGAPTAGANKVFADLNTLLALQTEIRSVYAALHPEGFNWLGILPLFFVAGLGAAVAAGAGTAAAAASTAATATGGGAGLAAAGGATAAELGTTASSLASIASALGGSTTSSVASAAATAISDLTGSSSLGGIVGNIVNGVGGLVGDIENIVSPLVHAGESVLSGIEELNNNFIKPVVDTIGHDYNTIEGLINEVNTLAHSGIQGILAIPDALSQAFTSLDAANLRLAKATGQINSGIATDVLVPGIGTAVATPLADIHQTLSDVLKAPVPDVGALSSVHLNESLTDLSQVTAQFNDLSVKLAEIPVFGKAIAWLVQGLNGIFADLGAAEHMIDLARQLGWEKFPVRPIGPGEAVRAWWRGQLSEADARTEMQRVGLDATRQTLLYDLEQWLPGLSDALKLFYRSAIDGTEMRAALHKQGMSDHDIDAMLNGVLEPLNPREVITANGRLSAAQAGFLQGTLTGQVPEEFVKLYPPRLANPNIAQFDWLEHWRVPALSWWITAYFRGLASAREVELAAQAENIPPEVIPNLVAVEQEVVQLWMIPDMLASGVFTEQEAKDYLHYIGLGDRDAAVIIKYGLAKSTAPTGLIAQQLAGIAVGAAKTMFQDGIINDSEYVEILESHKYTPEAAALTVALAKQEIDLAARKTYANGLIKQVEAGQITEQDLQTSLYNEGFTTSEVNGYLTQLKGEIAAKAKLPTLAELKEFWKAGIISGDDAVTLLQLDGYAPSIAQAFLTLWEGKTNAPSNTPATPPAG